MTNSSAPDTARPEDAATPAGSRLPLIPGPWETAVLVWKRLRRMSTALVLLFILATATLVATFIPQEPVIASTVSAWREGTEGPGAGVARVLDALSLFDVFGSWWFAVLTVALLVSLTACLIPRWRVFFRNVRMPANAGANLRRLSHSIELTRPAGASEDEVLDAVQPVFRTYRSRRVISPDGRARLAVERGHWREGGSLVFHTSFYLLLIGVALGSAFSFTGQIDIAEGERFADTPLGYQARSAGTFWDESDHRGAITTIDDFEVTYLDGDNRFVADEFVSTVTFEGADGTTRTEEIRVNHPVHFDGLTYYQRAFGFAPQVTVRSGLDGSDLFQSNMILRDDGGFWTGRAKITQGSDDPARPLPQIGMEVVFIPDASITDEGFRFNSPEPNNPRMAVTIYSADDLGLDRTVPVSQLEWPESAILGSAMITPGESAGIGDLGELGSLFEVEFGGGEITMWTGLQVSHQPFRWLILTAASLLLMGLIPSMYAYRRRVWVQVEDNHVLVAGVALHRKDRFSEEFEDLVSRVRGALPAATGPPPSAPAELGVRDPVPASTSSAPHPPSSDRSDL
ncbi:cytochrome c biogenesis protein ResB [Euzebya tangerina]|uniref:cytochrome c biogenesis protein ResB n=1 Tax=Euzebya tangerina TaxID=591198 RepID=UPI000E313020|nr:cytochrome c biogenesis protein ResB [Euzebya tangerina]